MSTLRKDILKIFGIGVAGIILFENTSLAVTGSVTASSVRIREKASSNSEVISVATEGEKVDVIGEEDGWYKVNFEKVTGYIKADYVKTDYSNSTLSTETTVEESESEEKEPEEKEPEETDVEENVLEETEPEEQNSDEIEQKEYEINSKITLEAEVSIKIIPSFTSKTLSNIATGTEVTVKGKLNKWLKITDGNVIGWALVLDTSGGPTNPEQNNTQPTDNTISPENSTSETISKTGFINVDSARIRNAPNGNVLDVIDYKKEVEIIGEEGDWYIINYNEYKKCYISKKLITLK